MDSLFDNLPDTESNVAPISSYSKITIRPASTALNSSKTLVLRLIKDAGIISKKELAYHSNLTPASITAIIKDLTASGLIKENGLVNGTHGRRMTGFSLVTDRFCTIAGRITSHYFAVGIYDINSKCLDVKKTYFDVFGDIRASTEAIAAEVYRYLDVAEDMGLEPLALVFGLMGDFRITRNEYIMIGKDGRYMDMKQFFTHEFSLPFYCENSNVFSAYHYSCRPDYGFLRNQTVVLVGISYSIDTVIMVDRHVMTGAANIPGVAGKTIMFGSSLEDYETLEGCISTQATLERARREADAAPYSTLKDIPELKNRDLINAFYEGDPVAVKVYTYVANVLGKYIAQLITLLCPHKILITDEIPMSETFERMVIDSTRHQLPRESSYFPDIVCLRAPARTTRLDPTIIGGSMFVTNKILQSVEWLDGLARKK